MAIGRRPVVEDGAACVPSRRSLPQAKHDIVVTSQCCGRFQAGVAVDRRLDVPVVQDATNFFVMAGMMAEKEVRGEVAEQVRMNVETECFADRAGDVSTKNIRALGCT